MNNQNSILLIDPSFDPAAAHVCDLLLKVGVDSFSYAIVNKETNQVIAVFDEQECGGGTKKLSERWKSDSYLNLPFNEIKVALFTENTIDIPNELYDPADLSVNAKYFTAANSANVYAQTQTHFDFTSIFSLEKFADKFIQNELSHAKIYHGYAGLLSIAATFQGNHLLFDFTPSSFATIYLQGNKVVFQKSYDVQDQEEFNYYLLLIINQLEINTADTIIQLAGIIHEGDNYYECLTKYFRDIQWMSADAALDQALLEDLPAHYYTSLLALNSCE